uniref:Transposase (putative) gypsy type domain-containing protein n=1 Tax=Musa acuminata subsp. malaccensis TaxID=214687 RepID=A0A804IDQ7_MUSAM
MSSTSSATSLLTTLFIILVPLSLLLLLLQDKRNSRGHPPCPPRLPLIGNLHQLGPLPHRSLHALSQQHGPLMLLRLGQVPALVVSSPDAAREVLRNQDHACASRPALKPARILVYGCKDLAFAPYGDYWKQLRKICSVHLLSPKRVQSYRLMREDEVESMMGKISSQASASANVIDLSEVLYSFANDVLCRVVSGKFTREEGRNRLFSELAGENSVLLSKIYVGDYFPWLGWLDMFFGSVARCNKNKARWDKLLDEVIKEHAVRSAQHGGEENDGEEKDFVDVLLSLQKDAAMDFVLTTEDIKALLEDMFQTTVVSNPNSSSDEKAARALEALMWPHDLDSTVSELTLSHLRDLYGIPEEFALYAPEPGQRAYDPIPRGFALTLDAFEAGLRLPLHPIITSCISWWRISPSRMAPNSWRYLVAFLGECHYANITPTRSLFLSCFRLSKRSGGYYLSARAGFRVSGAPSSNKGWKRCFFFVSRSKD